MRLVTFEADGAARLGVVDGEEAVDLARAAPDLPGDLLGLIRGGEAALRRAAEAAGRADATARRPLDGLRYRLPLANPGKIVCLGLNYVDHAAEGGHDRPTYPSFFLRTRTSLVPHGGAMLRPRCSEQLDYEAELAVVIGRAARHVARADALAYVAGYSCFNDGSIREYQRRTSQWTIGKNFDRTGGFGPVFVTADELPPGASGLAIATRLNGRTMQGANTRGMIFGVAETIELLTECLTLEPGDVLVMGTPAGVGHARRPQVWMRPGDVVEVEIEGVGVLRNPIEDEPAPAR